MMIKLVTPYLCTGKTHGHANDDGEGLRDGEYLAQMVLGDTLGEDGESRRALVAATVFRLLRRGVEHRNFNKLLGTTLMAL